MDFRMYDNAIGKFYGMDALSEKNHYLSPFQFGNGNPIYYSDPSGLTALKLYQDYEEPLYDNGGMEHAIGGFEGFDVFSVGGGGGGGSTGFFNGSGGGGGTTFGSMEELVNYAYSIMTKAKSNKFYMSNNGNNSFTVSWWEAYSISGLTEDENGNMVPTAGGGVKKMSKTLYIGDGSTPWMTTAQSQLGVTERTGNNDGKAVEMYLKTIGLGPGKKSYWCGAFVNWTLKENGLKTVNPAGRALKWREYGTSLSKPAFGAIATKNRVGGGHVGFVAGITSNGGIVLLGGNQNDSVNYTVYSPGTVFQYNFPSGYTPNYNLPILNISGGNIKEN